MTKTSRAWAGPGWASERLRFPGRRAAQAPALRPTGPEAGRASAFHHLLSLLRAEAQPPLPPARHRLGVMHILLGTWGPPPGWLTLSLLQEGLHGCCTGRSERNPGRREGHPLWVGVTGKIRDCPVLLPHPGGGHWVTPSLMQCTRGGLLPTAGRAPWEGRGGCRGTGWAGPPQLSCLATPLSAHSPLLAAGACWVMRAERGESRRAGQLGSPGISYNEGTEAPTLRAHVHCILGELPCAHLPGLLCLGDICDASSQL